MKKQILLTGGLGFIGSHLTKKLIANNFFPIIIDDLSNANKKILNSFPKNSFIFVRADINNKEKIINNIKKFSPQILIHLAAVHYIPHCLKNPKETNRINVVGTETTLEIAHTIGIDKFIFFSSAAVYKPSNKKHKETSKLLPMEVYGSTKLEAEEKIRRYCPKKNIKYTILRLFNVYGPNDSTPHFIPSILKRINKSNTVKAGNLETIRDYIYIDDLISVLLKIIREGEINNEIYNVGTGKGTTGNKIIKLIENIKGINVQIESDVDLVRGVDRKKLVANIQKLSNHYEWIPKYNIYDGLKKLVKIDE